MKYPKELKNSNGDIRVLYEKTHNIENMLKRLTERLDELCSIYNKQCAIYESRFGTLEERTGTLKYFVYGAILTSMGALIGVLINLVR